VPFGLDTFSQNGGPRAFGMGGHGGVDGGPLHVGPPLHQRDIQFDHIRSDERQQGQRARHGADIVEGDPAPCLTQLGQSPEELRGPVGEGPLGDLDHETHPACRVGQQSGGGVGAQHRRFEVDEEFETRGEVPVDGTGDGRVATCLIELGQPAGLGGPPERLLRHDPQGRPPGQGLRSDLLPGGEVVDRLVFGYQLVRIKELTDVRRHRQQRIPTGGIGRSSR